MSLSDPMGLLLAAARIDPTLMAAARQVEAQLLAARTHHRTPATILRYSCYYGDCEHEDECPEVTIDCCDACLSLAQAINDEIVPDECLAENCPVLVALEQVTP